MNAEQTAALQASSKLYRQSRKTLIGVIWFLIVVAITAYVFQIWNAVASINMLQTASPNDTFKENAATYQQYKNLAIGTVVMSTVELVVIFILLGAFYSYFNSTRQMFRIVKGDSVQTTTPSSSTAVNQGPRFEASRGITVFN